MGIVASTGFKSLDDQIDDCVKKNKNECKKKYPYYSRNYQCKKECQDKLIDENVGYDVRRDECDNLPTKQAKSDCERIYRIHDFNPKTYKTYAIPSNSTPLRAGNRTRHKKGKRNIKRRVR